jgi:hypothetical protein
MMQLSSRGQIKVNRRGLTELVLACAFLSLFTFALWSWQNNGYVAALSQSSAEGAAAGEVSLVPLILRNPAIMLSTVVTEFILLLALLLAIVPITWWLRSDYLIAGANQRVMTPLRWLGEKLRMGQTAKEARVGEYVINEAGERVFVPAPQEAVEEQEVVMVQQADGSLVAMVQQADGTMAPAAGAKSKEDKKEGEAQAADTPVPGPQQPSSLLNFEESNEEDPLADLADIGDILSSAFDDDSAIDPEREAMSRALAEISLEDLRKNTALVLATFKQ